MFTFVHLVHVRCSCSMGHRHGPWTCNVFTQHFHTASSCSIFMQHEHSARRHGHEAWTLQHGQHKPAAWAYSLDMQHGDLDMQIGHGHAA